jgi:hypothetical protein
MNEMSRRNFWIKWMQLIRKEKEFRMNDLKLQKN